MNKSNTPLPSVCSSRCPQRRTPRPGDRPSYLATTLLLLLSLPWLVGLDENSYSTNQARLAAMSPEELEQIQRNRDRFALMSDSEKARLRRLDDELHREPNAELLMQTLRGYHEWLSTLRSTDRAALKDLPADARIAKINELISASRERDLGLTNATRLPAEDNEAVRKWAQEFVQRKQAEIGKIFSSPERPPVPGSRRGGPQAYRLFFAVAQGAISDEKLEEIVTDQDLELLLNALSAKAKEILADQTSNADKLKLAFRWFAVSYSIRVADEELRRFLREDLDDAQREMIYRLGPEEGRQQLIRMYEQKRRNRLRGPDGGPGPPLDEPRRRPEFEKDSK